MAGRTNDAAGDGTTTASVLARDMIHYGLQVGTIIPTAKLRHMLCAMSVQTSHVPSKWPVLYIACAFVSQPPPSHMVSWWALCKPHKRLALIRESANCFFMAQMASAQHSYSEVCACAAQYVTAGANPISVKKGIDKTCDFLVEKLREKAQPVKGSSDIKVRCCRSSCTGLRFAAWLSHTDDWCVGHVVLTACALLRRHAVLSTDANQRRPTRAFGRCKWATRCPILNFGS